MHTLKVASTELGIHHEDAIGPFFARSFVNQLESAGRINEISLILRIAIRKPRLLLTLGPGIYLRLLRSGRVKLRTEKVKNIDDLRKMSDWIISSHFTMGSKVKT